MKITEASVYDIPRDITPDTVTVQDDIFPGDLPSQAA